MESERSSGRVSIRSKGKTFADPQLASFERHYKEWQAHQLLEDHRNARH